MCARLLAVLFGLGCNAASIPPVADRDPNPSTSPKIKVNELVMNGIQPFEHLGITQETVAAFLRNALRKAQEAATPSHNGFTAQELQEVARALDSMDVHERKDALSPAESLDLVELVRAQKTRRGISIVELERIAERLGEFYRDRGLFLSVGYLPSQKVVDERVEIGLLPGTLAQVNVADPLIHEAFEHSLGRPVERDAIESILFMINRLPGVQAQGVFTAGDEVGETKLDLSLLDAHIFRGDLRLDNHGDRYGSSQRLIARYARASLLRHGDDLSFGLLAGLNPADSHYGWLRYEIPVATVRNRWFVEVGNNEFSWNPPGAQFEGDSFFGTAGMRRIFTASRTRALAGKIAVSHHQLGLSGAADQRFWFATGALTSSWVLDRRKIAIDANLQVNAGRVQSGLVAAQDPFLWRSRASVHGWKLVSIPFLDAPQKVSISITGQLADTRLPDSLRMTLGGAYRVRAFDPSVAIVDRGAVMNLDLRLAPRPIARYGDILLFVDAAIGESYGAIGDSEGERESKNVRLAAVGIGFDWHIGRRVRSVISWAVPTSSKGSGGRDYGSRFYWTISYAP